MRGVVGGLGHTSWQWVDPARRRPHARRATTTTTSTTTPTDPDVPRNARTLNTPKLPTQQQHLRVASWLARLITSSIE